MGLSTCVQSGMVVLLSLLWMSQFHTVWATIGRYGGGRPMRRPIFSQPASYGRPNFPYQGQVIASPTHAYPILAKPPPQFQQQPQQFQQQPQQFQQSQQQFQQQPQQFQQQQQFQPQPQFQQPQFQPQPIRYQNPTFQFQQQQNTVRFPQQQQQQASQLVPQYYVQSPVQYYNPVANQDRPQPAYFSYQTPTSFTVHSNSRPNSVHYHVHSGSQTKPISYDSATSGSNQVLSYEGCTSSHWQPLQGTGISSSASAPSPSIAMAPSSSHPTYFYGASVSPSASYSNANTRTIQNQQSQLSNKVVVLSHDVLKTLLANSNKTSSRPAFDSVGSASSNSHVVVSSNSVNTGAVTNSITDQPSVKLVGYIGPSSDNTPTGYLQIPINKHLMEGLSGSQTSYDFALNSTNYSLFTLKSVNDVQAILGTVKGGDTETSASSSSSSQTIPLGLVISNEPKSNTAASDPIFYSSAASSPVATVTTTSGNPVNPSIQMVGHVQITSPDVSSHFVKRQDAVEPIMVA